MALNAATYKIEQSISDMHRVYYATHALTLARHASETDARLMLQLLALALQADERLCRIQDGRVQVFAEAGAVTIDRGTHMLSSQLAG